MTLEPSDDDLLADCTSWQQGWEQLYERHASAVHAFAARRVGPAAADDVLGEVFARALESVARYRPHRTGSALPWLYGIAANVVRAHLRTRRPSAVVDLDVGVDWHAVDDRLDARVHRDQLRHVLASLSPAEREVFLLVAWEGLTTAEAAHALDLAPSVARTRLSRARQRARAALATSPAPTH